MKHYKDLWYNPNEVHIEGVSTDEDTYWSHLITGIDAIGKDEVEEALTTSANRKATSLDGINMELLEYYSEALISRLRSYLNTCLQKCIIPKPWRSA
jgi:hypothetical protein